MTFPHYVASMHSDVPCTIFQQRHCLVIRIIHVRLPTQQGDASSPPPRLTRRSYNSPICGYDSFDPVLLDAITQNISRKGGCAITISRLALEPRRRREDIRISKLCSDIVRAYIAVKTHLARYSTCTNPEVHASILVERL